MKDTIDLKDIKVDHFFFLLFVQRHFFSVLLWLFIWIKEVIQTFNI